MNNEEIEGRIKLVFIEKLGIEEEQYQPSAKIAEDLGADSLDVVELVMGFEDEFSIDVGGDEAEKLLTVGDAINFITALVVAKAEGNSTHKPKLGTSRNAPKGPRP
ncbi:MAG: acyl carrier protein [Betaproteobacteria bacterium]